MAEVKSVPDRVILVQPEEDLTVPAKLAYGLMYAGPAIQTALILVVSFVGHGWVSVILDYAHYIGTFGGRRAPEALQLRTLGWLIALTCAFGAIQVIGALLMPFHVKLRHVFSVMSSAAPMIALVYVVFMWFHQDLKLDDIQRLTLWFSFWSVLGGFGLGIGARMAIMSGRKSTNVMGGGGAL